MRLNSEHFVIFEKTKPFLKRWKFYVKFPWIRREDTSYKYSLSDGSLDNSHLHVEETHRQTRVSQDVKFIIVLVFNMLSYQLRKISQMLGRLCSTRSWFIFGNYSNYKALRIFFVNHSSWKQLSFGNEWISWKF